MAHPINEDITKKPEAAADDAIKLVNMAVEEKRKMGLRGNKRVLIHLNCTILAKRFLESLNE